MKNKQLILKFISAVSIFIVPIPGQKIAVPNGAAFILMAFDDAGFNFETLLGYLGLIGLSLIFFKNKWLSGLGYLLALDGVIITLITNERVWSIQKSWLFWLFFGIYLISAGSVIYLNFRKKAVKA